MILPKPIKGRVALVAARLFFVLHALAADKCHQKSRNLREKFKNPLINAEKCGIV